MSDDTQHEPGDELLSAYLDDELSADERALVEARLATDPAAQQLLDQLRNVSHSVRALPPISVGRDFRESIIRRVEAAKTSPAPTISIGRTRRGWVWASLAVAAALMIMFFQSDDNVDDDLPAIAASRDKAKTELNSELAEAPAQWRARGESVATRDSRRLDETGAFEAKDLGLNEGFAAKAPSAPAAGSTPAPSTPAPTSLAAPANSSDLSGPADLSTSVESLALSNQQPESRFSRTEISPTESPAEAVDESEQPADENGLVVVHVLAKPAAIKERKFDQLLASNGVAVDPVEDPAPLRSFRGGEKDQPAVTSGRLQAQARTEQETKEPAADRGVASEPQFGEEDVDVVLVEAPSDTIFACVEDLSHDSENYLGVAVDALTTTDGAKEGRSVAENKLVNDLGKFNRGAVETRATDTFGDKSHYYAYDAASETAVAAPTGGGGTGGFGAGKQEAAQQLVRENSFERGRARRLQPVYDESKLARSEAAPLGGPSPRGRSAPSGEMLKRAEALRQLKASRSSADDRMQVLFVLRSGDEPTPSASADDPQE
jgi:hypothetical protein